MDKRPSAEFSHYFGTNPWDIGALDEVLGDLSLGIYPILPEHEEAANIEMITVRNNNEQE